MDAVDFLNKTMKSAKVNTTGQFGAFMDLVSDFSGKVVVNKLLLDLFAAALTSAVEAGQADRSLLEQFQESIGGNAGVFLGE